MLSAYPEQGQDEWIIAQRPPRNQLDPYKPYGFFLERELSGSGRLASSAVILLTNRECPWRCLMCDLWKNTLPYTVPPGAIPAQIEYALERIGSRPEQIKLYNSGSFFDPAAIPVEDYPLIAEKVSVAARVIVESHPKLIGERTIAFRDELTGSQLEVAMGLETIHPAILPRLNKKMSCELFLEAAGILNRARITLRVFVLIKPPLMNESETVEWTLKSAEFAFECGAAVVSLIPTRGGNGAMDRLIESGEFSPPPLNTVEKAFEECLALVGKGVKGRARLSPAPRGTTGKRAKLGYRGVFAARWGQTRPTAGSFGQQVQPRVFVDTWNLEQFSRCPHCFEQRRSRLCQMNLTQKILPAIDCSFCKGVT